MYYDNRGRVIQTKSTNQLAGGYEKEYVAYNFTGQPVSRKHIHTATGKTTQTELYTYTYDNMGRLLKTKHKLNGGSEVTLVDNVYDALGRLMTNKRNGDSDLLTSYTYNIRSWTKSISSPLFNETLYYNDARPSSAVANVLRFNGNISAMDWKISVTGDNVQRGYNFAYDDLSRLTNANYLVSGTSNANFTTAYAYDKQGNITHLTRRGNMGTTTYGLVDNVAFTYQGNQLKSAEDAVQDASVGLSASADFKDKVHNATEYAYDTNGNQTMDSNSGITSIEYNLRNLPKKITFAGNISNDYTYSAAGTKLSVVHNSAVVEQTDYIDNMIYKSGTLNMIQVDGGYIKDGQYYFYIQDHLGSTRVVANATGSVVQRNHYYPYGALFAESYNPNQQPFKYIGKELDTKNGLNWTDLGARFYTGLRLSTQDPLAEKYYSVSPYAYCMGNPINNVDLRGDTITTVINSVVTNADGTTSIQSDRYYYGQDAKGN
jgi:RHS repeat-associated protein